MPSLRHRTVTYVLILAASAMAAGYSRAAEGGAGPVPTTDKPAAIPDPGHDEERGPESDGRRFAALTPLGAAELDAADPSYRAWAERIRDGRADKRIMRLHHFYRSRLDPFDRPVPEGWREPVWARLRDARRTVAAVGEYRAAGARRAEGDPGAVDLSASDRLRGARDAPSGVGGGIDPSGVWRPIGPYTIPGRVTAIARAHGAAAATLYAVTADGGVWRTVDAGQTWETLTDFEITLSGGALLIDPIDPRTIYFGTGEGNGAIDNYPGAGLLKSVDGGLSWSSSNVFSSGIRGLAMHADAPSRIFAAGDDGCYVSADGGATFSHPANGMPFLRASAVVVRPDDADVAFCATWSGSGADIYRTDDGGLTWVASDAGLNPGATGRISLAVSQSDPDVMIAGVQLDSGLVYKSTDGGSSWQATALSGYCGSQCWYDNVVGIDPADPQVLYAGGINAWVSGDGGLNWSQMSSSAGGRGAPNYVHVDMHVIHTPSAGEVILGSDGGIFRSTDYGSNWDEWSVGMDSTQYYGICRRDGDPGWAFGGTQDNGSHRRRPIDDPEWAHVLGGDGGMCMTGPAGSDIIVGEYQFHNMQRSTSDGAGWSGASGGIGDGEPRPWVGIMTADPSDRNTMWTGTDRVYRSLDARATNWVPVSTALAGGNSVSALEVARTNSTVVWVGFSGGSLYVGGNTLGQPQWRNARIAEMPARTVRRIRSSPDTFLTAYAVFGGFGSGKIWKTIDRGNSWSDVTGDLPDVPVNDLLIDPDAPGTLLAATDLGVFRSDDDGTSWYGFSNGLPSVASIEFTFDDSSGTLRLGTHGRSMWEWGPAVDQPLAVADGGPLGGTAMQAVRLAGGQMRVSWDVGGCVARDYYLAFGDLDDVASRSYSGATCAIGNGGVADVPQPTTPSGSAYFVVVATDGDGAEGPHGVDSFGQPLAANGIGLCGVTTQQLAEVCP